MRVRKVDKNHDWTFGQGLNNYANKSDAIYLSVKMILLSVRNDWFLDLEHGINWFEYWNKNPDMLAMEMDIKTNVLNVEGVVRIDSYEVSIDPDTRESIITLSYTDIYGENRNVDNNR